MKRPIDTCHSEWGDLHHVMRLFSAAESRQLDEKIALTGGVSLLQLMEQAGSVAADYAERQLPAGHPVLILAGAGQNGGDGWVAARILSARGLTLTVFDFAGGKELPPEASLNREAARTAGIAIQSPDLFLAWPQKQPALIMDALFGSGFCVERGMPAIYADAIAKANQLVTAGSLLLAVDLPSGIDATTGAAAHPAIRADLAVSFVRPKIGQYSHPGVLYQTVVETEPLGIQPGQIEAVLDGSSPGTFLMTDSAAAALLEPFRPDRHKGLGGKAALIGGSRNLPGAVVLAAKAMAMTGVGYISVLAEEGLKADLLSVIPEALQPVDPDLEWLEKQDAVAYGPGLGDFAAIPLSDVIRTARELVIDADGLNRLALLPAWQTLLRERKTPAVLTPHVGEFKRLALYSEHDRTASAAQLAKDTGSIVVLKGMATVTATPEGAVLLNPTGNAGLAKGGSGDVLSGLIAGLLAGGLMPLQAAAAAVYIHGKAADLAAAAGSRRTLLPQDVIAFMPQVFRSFE